MFQIHFVMCTIVPKYSISENSPWACVHLKSWFVIGRGNLEDQSKMSM